MGFHRQGIMDAPMYMNGVIETRATRCQIANNMITLGLLFRSEKDGGFC